MKILKDVSITFLILSIIAFVGLTLVGRNTEGMGGFGVALVGMIPVFVGGLSLLVLIIVAIIEQMRTTRNPVFENAIPQSTGVRVTKIVLLLVVLACISIVCVPIVIWAIEIFNPTKLN